MTTARYHELPKGAHEQIHRPRIRSSSSRLVLFLVSAIIVVSLLILFQLYWTTITEEIKEESTPTTTTRKYSRRPHFIRPGYTFRPPIGGKLNCDKELIKPSEKTPTDVNRVRPADIGFVAALGDSITAGSHSVDNSSQIALWDTEWRDFVGNSFDIGGNGQLDNQVLIPTIIRSLNPNLKGYSIGSGLAREHSVLNVAIPGMWSSDFPRQAAELVLRAKTLYKKEELSTEWKLIHFFIGTNDISGICYHGETTTKQQYKEYLQESIQIIQSSFPRTIVSLVGMWNLDFSIRAAEIIANHTMGCKEEYIEKGQARILEYNEALFELESDSRLHNDNATVVVQKVFEELMEPLKKKSGEYNIDFYATDVFHLSKYGNSVVAKSLWSQLLQPVGSKKTTPPQFADESPDLACPDKECPFIRTPANSKNCS